MDAGTNTTCACPALKYYNDGADTCETCENVRCATCSSVGDICGK